MNPSRKGILYRLWDIERGPYWLLALTVVTVFVTSPLVVAGLLDPVMFDVVFSLFLFAGVLTVHPHRAVRYFVLTLVALALLVRVPARLFPGTAITILEALIDVGATGIFATLVMKQFLVSGRTASHRISGAIVVYLLIGVVWARLYQIAGLLIPGAFHMEDGRATLSSYLYFSFVTLATIGYGDISPIHPVTRNLAIVEAVTGQMYIAVLIARLVSTSDSNK